MGAQCRKLRIFSANKDQWYHLRVINRSDLINDHMLLISAQRLTHQFASTQCQIGLLFFPLHYFHSFRDGLGVKKSNFFYKKICSVFALEMSHNWDNFKKLSKVTKNHQKNACFFIVFQIFSILGSILAQKPPNANSLALSRSFSTQAILEAVKVVE